MGPDVALWIAFDVGVGSLPRCFGWACKLVVEEMGLKFNNLTRHRPRSRENCHILYFSCRPHIQSSPMFAHNFLLLVSGVVTRDISCSHQPVSSDLSDTPSLSPYRFAAAPFFFFKCLSAIPMFTLLLHAPLHLLISTFSSLIQQLHHFISLSSFGLRVISG